MPVLTIEQLTNQINPQTGLKYNRDEALNYLDDLSLQQALKSYTSVSSPTGQESVTVSIKQDIFGGTELDSYLDRGITPTPGVDIQELRAQEQSWGDKVANGLIKASSTAVTSGLENLLSIPSALYEYATTDKGLVEAAYNSPVGRGFDSFNSAVADAFPNYYTQAEEEAGLLGRVGSVNFWADKFANGAGYMAGAVASGYGLSKLFNFAKLAQAGKLNQLNVADEMATLNNIGQLGKSAKITDAAGQLAISSIMSHGESAVEARGIYNTVKDDLLAKRQQGLINLSDEQIEKEAEAAGNVGYGLNMAIVGFTNYLQFGQSLAKNYTNTTKTINEIGLELGEGTIKATAKQPGKMLSKQFLTSKGFDRLSRFGAGSAEEAAQEGGQFVTEEGLTEYYNRKYDNDANNDFASITDGLFEGFEKAFTTTDGLESMLLGALLGGPSQVVLNKGQFDEKVKRTEEVANLLNSTPIKQRVNNMKTIISLNKDMMEAAEVGDSFVFKNLEYDQFKTWVKDISDNGGYELLLEKLDMVKDLTDEEFKKTFGFDVSQPLPDTKENIVSKVKERAAQINQKAESIKLKHGSQPQAVQDAIFDAVTNFDNIDERESELSQKISQLTDGNILYNLIRGKNRTEQEYKELFNERLREWKKTATPDKVDEVNSLVKDLSKLANRREKYINQYNQALKDPNSFSLKDKIAKDLEEQERLYQQAENEFVAELYSTNTNEDAEFGFDSSEFELEVSETKQEATEITYTDKDGNEQTVLAVTPLTEKTNKDITWINFTDSEGKKRGIMKDKVLAQNPSETTGKKSVKVKYKKGDVNNVYDADGNAYSVLEYIEQIDDNAVIKTIKAQRQELVTEAQKRALTELISINENTLDLINTELMEVQKKVDNATELLTKSQNNKTGKTTKVIEGKKVVFTILQLEEQVNKLLETLNTLQEQKEKLLNENYQLEGELESIGVLQDAYDLRPYKAEIENAIMRTEAIIAKTEEKISNLQKVINRLKSIVKGFYTSYKNLLQKKYGDITVFNYNEVDLDPELTTLSENEQRVADKVFLNEETLQELNNTLTKNKEYLKFLQDQLNYINEVNKIFEPILQQLIKEKNNVKTDTKSKKVTEEVVPSKEKEKEFDGLSQRPSITNPGFNKTVGQHYDAQENETAIPSKKRWFRALPNLPLGDGSFSIKFVIPNTKKDVYDADEILLHRDSPEEANIKVILYRNGKPVNSKGEAIDEVNIPSEGLFINIGLSELTTTDFGFKFHDVANMEAEEVAPIVNEYNNFRNEVYNRLVAGEEVFSPVTGKGNGVINTTSEYSSVETVLDSGTSLNDVKIIIPTAKGKKTIDYPITATQTIKLTTGMPYMVTPEGNVVPLNNRVLTEQEANTAFNLLSLMGKGLTKVYKSEDAKKADTPLKKSKKIFEESKRGKLQKRGKYKGKKGFWVIPKNEVKITGKGTIDNNFGLTVTGAGIEFINIKDYLESLIFMGKNNSNPETRIYTEKGVLYYGENKVDLKDVNKKKDEIISFLMNKYIQISTSKLIESENKIEDKYEEIVEVTSDGIAILETYPNYKHFLLSSENKTVDEIPLTTNLVSKDSNEPQFKSQYATFSPQISNTPINTVVNKEEQKKAAEDIFGTEETLPTTELTAVVNNAVTPEVQTSTVSPFAFKINVVAPTEQQVTEAINEVKNESAEEELLPNDFFESDEIGKDVNDDAAPFKIAKSTISEEDRINIQEAKKWLEEKIGLPVEVSERLIAGKAFGQFANNVIKLSKLGYKGVEYHEALHGVMRAFLTPNEYQSIIKEAAEKYSAPSKKDIVELQKLYPKLNLKELINVYYEEKIADAFEDYVLSKGKIIPPGFKTKSFFEKLWETIKKMLNLSPTDMQDLFERIESGYYRGKAVRLNSTSSIYSALPQMSEEETKIILDGLTGEFMSNIFKNNYSVESINTLSPNKILEYYNKAKQSLFTNLAETANNPIKEKIKNYLENTNNWNELLQAHKEFLQQFGFELSGQLVTDEEGNIINDESVRESSFDNNAVNISVKDTTSSFVKLLIGTLPKRRFVNSKEQFIYDGNTGFIKLEDGGEVFNFLLNNLVGVNDYNKMIEILKAKGRIYPTINGLVKRLELQSNNPEQQFRLQKQFQQTFSKAKFDYDLWLIGSGGTIYPINPNSNKLEDKLKDNWKSTIKELALNKNPYFKRDASTGQIKTNVEYAKKKLEVADTRKDIEPWIKAVKFLEAIGFKISNPDMISNQDKLDFLQNDYPHIISIFLNPDYTVDDIFGAKESTRINKLISLEANNQSDTVELMHIGPDGKTRYGVSLNNYFTSVTNVLNSGLNLDEIENKYPELFGFFNKNSLFLNKDGLLFDKKGKRTNKKFKISISEGIKPQDSGEGETFDELGFSDRVMLSFNSVLDNKFPIIRTSDKTLEFQMEIDLGIKNDISNQKEGIFDIIRGYLVSETLRVKDVSNGLYNDVQHFNNRGKEFIMFKFLSTGLKSKLESSTNVSEFIETNKEEINKEIQKYFDTLKGKYSKTLFDENLLEYQGSFIKNKGISENFVQEVEESYSKGYITQEGLNKLLEGFIAKSFIANIEQHMLFFGDPAFYKSASDFFKRTSGASGTKKFAFVDEHTNAFVNEKLIRFDKKKTNRETIKTLVYDDVQVMSKYYDAIEKRIGKNAAKAYKDMTEADAQGIISLDEYREFMTRASEWSSKHELLYQKIIGNKELTNIEVDFILQPLKLQYFGNQDYNNDRPRNERLNVPTFYKYSVVPMIPQVIKGTALEKLSERMIKEQIGIVTFASGAKVGAKLQSTGNLLPFYDNKGQVVLPNENVNYNYLPYQYLGIQLDINPKVKQKVTFGTQFRKLIKSNLFTKGVAKNPKALELATKYDSLVSKITDKRIDDLLKEVGATKTNTGWKVTNFNKFKELLKKSAVERQAPANLIDSIDSITDKDGLIRYKIDALPNRNKIENILLAIINNTAIKQKVNGGAKIQMATSGWEKSARKFNKEGILLSNELEFYRIENGKVLPMQVKIPLPAKMKSYALYLGDGNLEKGLEILNVKVKELIDNRNNPNFNNGLDRRIINIVGYRIPTQGLNSIENMEIAEFLHPSAGELIVVPTEIVAKSGSDFDVDKLSIIEPYFKTNIEGFTSEFRKFIQDSSQDNVVLETVKSFNDEVLSDLIDDLNSFSITSGKGTKGDLKPHLEKEGASKEEIDFYWELKNLLVEFNKIKQLLNKDISLQYIENVENEKAWLNGIIQTSIDILEMPENFNELITPNGVENLEDLAEEIYNYEKGNESIVEKSETLEVNAGLEWDTIQKMAQSFLSGKKGVGIAALQRTHHVLSQTVNLAISPFIGENIPTEIKLDGMEGEYSLANEYDIKKQNKISDIISEFINGYVDVAKKPFVFTINAGLNAANTWLYLIRRGVPVKLAGYFMNQPIIKDYLKAQELNESVVNVANDLEESKAEVLKTIYSKYLSALKQEQKLSMPKDVIEETNTYPSIFFNEENLKKYIIEGSKKGKTAPIEYYKNQIIILRDFINYQNQAKLLGDLVNVTKQDTTTPKNLAGAYLDEKIFNKVMEETPFINAEKLITDTFLKSFKNVHNIEREVYNEFFVTEKPQFKKYIDLIVDEKLALSREKLEEIIDKFKNSFVQYLITSANYKGKSVASYFKDLFIGKGTPVTSLQEAINDRTLPEVIKAIQTSNIKFKNNPIFKELVAILSNGDVSERSIYDNLKLFSRKMTKYESDVLTAGLRELAEKAEGSLSKQVFERLFLFSVIQSGIGNSPFSFYDKLPFDATAPLVSAALNAYEANPNVNLAEFFIQFYMNNLNNSTLVPKIKSKALKYVKDNSYTDYDSNNIPELKESIPSVIKIPLEGQGSYLSKNPVLKTWASSTNVEEKKKQGKRIGMWIPYVLAKSENGFNYYTAVSPIGNAPYFNQYGKFETLTPLTQLPFPNANKTLVTYVAQKESIPSEPKPVQEENWTEEENNCKTPFQ
jgi:hypothetical protein